MGSQTEYIFQKPGLKKSMENCMFFLKYRRNSENRGKGFKRRKLFIQIWVNSFFMLLKHKPKSKAK